MHIMHYYRMLLIHVYTPFPMSQGDTIINVVAENTNLLNICINLITHSSSPIYACPFSLYTNGRCMFVPMYFKLNVILMMHARIFSSILIKP